MTTPPHTPTARRPKKAETPSVHARIRQLACATPDLPAGLTFGSAAWHALRSQQHRRRDALVRAELEAACA